MRHVIPMGEKRNHIPDRRYGLRPVARAAEGITRRAFGKRGFAMGEILKSWPQMVGGGLADYCQPERLHFPQGKGDGGTLWIRAEGKVALEIQHSQPVLIGRINRHCGFRAVADLRIVQGPVAIRALPPPPPRKLAAGEKSALEAALTEVEDPDLRAALARLGSGVYARKKPC